MTGTGVGPELIRLSGVDAGYDHQVVLHDVNVHVHEDQFTGIVGPSGSGKTTLLEVLCKRLRDRYDLVAITNDIYTKEDQRLLTLSGASARH